MTVFRVGVVVVGSMDFGRVQENLRPAFNMSWKSTKWPRAICCTGNFHPCIIYWIL